MKIASNRFLLISSLLLFIFLGESCRNRSIMLRTPHNYKYDDLSQIPQEEQYKIGINDNVDITISTNKGAGIIENDVNSNNGIVSSQRIDVIVDYDGTVKIPIIGRVLLKGLTYREAELLMEEKYKQIYIDPFVVIKVLNKRVLLFVGRAGSATVLTLTNQNTSLLEALATTGGIQGKAKKIKLIRGDFKNPKVYLIDLSTIDGLEKANMTLLGNDIIYVQPLDDLAANFTNRLTSLFVLVNTFLFLYTIIPKN
jgi:polysaccharide export outer membrane protein